MRPFFRRHAPRPPAPMRGVMVSLLCIPLAAGCHAASTRAAPSAPSAPSAPGAAAPVAGGMSSGANLSAGDLNPAMSAAQKQAVLRRKQNE